ncbi:MAG: hypothetical protein ACN4GF_08260 [Lentimonas sp.]
MKNIVLALTSLFAASQIANAHTSGHDGGLHETATHLVTQPSHLLTIFITILSVALIFCARRIVLNQGTKSIKIDQR